MWIWRPILAQVATLEEIETHYSFDDLLDVNEALDVKHEAEEFYLKKSQDKSKRRR